MWTSSAGNLDSHEDQDTAASPKVAVQRIFRTAVRENGRDPTVPGTGLPQVSNQALTRAQQEPPTNRQGDRPWTATTRNALPPSPN